MCGIGGILLKGHGSAGRDAMAQRLWASLRHRGRFDEGAFSDDRVSLYAARHAVIAVQEARQPLGDREGRLAMVGNGEVFNYRELTADSSFHRRSRVPPGDLQVALELLAERGPGAFEDLRGPFALAVWDKERGELTLVRDRLGERPLYYYDTPDMFMFASEARCIEAALQGGLHLDETSVLSFIGLGRTLADRTMFREVKSVAPGCVLRIGTDHQVRQQMVPIPELRDASTDVDEAEVLRLIHQANRRALVADGPVAVGFSGGIDSSAVLKATLQETKVAAAITVFSDRGPGIDENLRRARAVSRVFGVDLVEVPFSIPSLEDTVDLLDSTLDGPAAEPLVLHNDALHTAAREYAPVLLGGHGADEVFGGYARYGDMMAESSSSTTSEWMSASKWERWNRASRWKQFVDEKVAKDFLPLVDLTVDELGRPFPYEKFEEEDPVLFGQALDLFRLMSYDNFRATDENGLARGVEVRSPFFDIDLIAGVFALPLHLRIVPGVHKRLLQQVFHGTPLESVFVDTKVGFDDAFSYVDWISENWTPFSRSITRGPVADMGILRADVLSDIAMLDWRLLWRLFSLSTWMTRRGS